MLKIYIHEQRALLLLLCLSLGLNYYIFPSVEIRKTLL